MRMKLIWLREKIEMREKKNEKIKIWKDETLLAETDIGTNLVWSMMRYVSLFS